MNKIVVQILTYIIYAILIVLALAVLAAAIEFVVWIRG